MNSRIKKRYEVKDLVQEETLSLVYIGLDTLTNKPVQIIQYNSEVLSKDLLNALITIANKLNQIQLENLENLMDYHFDGITFSLVYEKKEAVPLSDFLKQDNKKSMKLLWKISSQILKVIYLLNQKGMFHGLLNLSNIQIDDDHKVVISKSCIDSIILKHNLANIEGVDDGGFLAPDYFGNEPLDLQSDIYCFGMLLYVFFSHKWPYPFTNKIKRIKSNYKKPPAPFEKIDSRIPDKLTFVIMKSLEIEKSNRFSSVEELITHYRRNKQTKAWKLMDQKAMDPSLNIDSPQLKLNRVPRRLLQVGIFLLTVAMALIISKISTVYLNKPPNSTIPQLVGVELSSGISLLNDHHLSGSVYLEKPHHAIKKGHIIETKPSAGREVKVNREIKIIVSKGMPEIRVPNLIGKDINAILFTYGSDSLPVTIDNKVYSLEFPKNYVVSQSVEVDGVISPTDSVRLTLSKGLPVEVIVTRNMSKETNIIAKVNFEILENWPRQNISVFYSLNNDRQKLYSDYHSPNESVSLEFKIKPKGTLEVYYDEELGYKNILDYGY